MTVDVDVDEFRWMRVGGAAAIINCAETQLTMSQQLTMW